MTVNRNKNRLTGFWGRALCFALILFCGACVSGPQKRIAAICRDCTLQMLNAKGEYPLSVYLRNITDSNPSQRVHVYLEGDGRPWIGGKSPATDPTSHQLTALHLMMLDPGPSVYLNRPCYGLDSMPANCKDVLWTGARYSKEVVTVLNQALDQLQNDLDVGEWVLMGHSGGGALAMLIAHHRVDVAAVVTLAANLDHRSWTDHFGYLALENSLNPVDMPPLPSSVLRWHFAAPDDQEVPAFLTAAAAANDPSAQFTLATEGDHSCCWRQLWPQILRNLNAAVSEGARPPLPPVH